MTGVMKALKDEMTRVSRKEMKNMSAPYRRQLAELKKAVAAQTAVLARIEKSLAGAPAKAAAGRPAAKKAGAAAKQVSPRSIKAVRKRLKLNQPDFAKLLGVSLAALRSWEQGRSNPRAAGQAAIASARAMTAPQARQKLGRPAPTRGRKKRKTRSKAAGTKKTASAGTKKARSRASAKKAGKPGRPRKRKQ